MTNKAFSVALTTTIILVSSYSFAHEEEPITGKWKGGILENEKTIILELQLTEQSPSIAGFLTVLSKTGQDAEQGMTFPIVQGQITGCSLKLTVAMKNAKIDGDSIVLNLIVEGEEMNGYGYELRTKGRKIVPAYFKKQD